MAGLLKLKAEYPDARLVVGNTEVGIEMKFKDARYPVLIGVTHIPELNHMEVGHFLHVHQGLWMHGAQRPWCSGSLLDVPCLECTLYSNMSLLNLNRKDVESAALSPAPLVHANQPTHQAFDIAS